MCRCKAVVTMCRANFRHHPWVTSGSGSGFPPYEVLVRKRRPMVSEKLGLGGWAHPDSVLQVCHVRDNPVEESGVVPPSPQKVKDSRHYRCRVERRFRAVGTQKKCPLNSSIVYCSAGLQTTDPFCLVCGGGFPKQTSAPETSC